MFTCKKNLKILELLEKQWRLELWAGGLPKAGVSTAIFTEIKAGLNNKAIKKQILMLKFCVLFPEISIYHLSICRGRER